jgi:hypothetical protein
MYAIAYFSFEPESVIFYIVIHLAFLPIDILIVTLVIENIISKKEKETILEKLDMIMGVFFSEIGTEFLAKFSALNKNGEEIQQTLSDIANWNDNDYKDFLKSLKEKTYEPILQLPQDDRPLLFEDIKKTLIKKREFLMRLLENPNLHEKDCFSNLILAIFHLDDELEKRETFENIPEADFEHLLNDIDRVYSHLIYEWIYYLHYLKNQYPYMFSIVIRTNPFDKDSDIYVRE